MSCGLASAIRRRAHADLLAIQPLFIFVLALAVHCAILLNHACRAEPRLFGSNTIVGIQPLHPNEPTTYVPSPPEPSSLHKNAAASAVLPISHQAFHSLKHRSTSTTPARLERSRITKPIIDASSELCPNPTVCVAGTHVPLLCMENTVVSDQGSCQCCELTGGNHKFREDRALERTKRQAERCPNNEEFFCLSVLSTSICKSVLGELDCGTDHVCCEIVPLSENPVVATSGHVQSASNIGRPQRGCPKSTGAHNCVLETFAWTCDDDLGQRDCPTGQTCCYTQALSMGAETGPHSAIGVESETCAAPQTCVDRLSSSVCDISKPTSDGGCGTDRWCCTVKGDVPAAGIHSGSAKQGSLAALGVDPNSCPAPRTCVGKLSSFACDSDQPIYEGGCGTDKLCCTLGADVPTGVNEGSPNGGIAIESEVDKEVRRCLELTGAPSDSFERLLESRTAIGLSADFGEPMEKKCFHVGGECMPADQGLQCEKRSNAGERHKFDQDYHCLPPNSICCKRLEESEPVVSVGQRASQIASSNFACLGKEGFAPLGSFLPLCWLVEIFNSRFKRIAAGALVKLDVVSTSASALGALNPAVDKFYVRVGLNRKQHLVSNVILTDFDGAGASDKKKDLAFLFLEKPANVDEASACTICFATFDYHPDCFDGAEMQCQAFDYTGGWKRFPINNLSAGGGHSSAASDCSSALGFAMAPHQWCLPNSMTGFCPNYPGVPVVCTMKDGEPRLFGHWSEPIGKKCAQSPSVVNLLTNSFSRAVVFKKDDSVGELHCGTTDLETRIFNGEGTDTSLWPWLVTILYRPPSGLAKVICGGSLISPRFVLTAAHCFEVSSDPGRYYLASGNEESYPRDKSIDPFVQTSDAALIKVHPEYNRRNFYANDIAVVALKDAFIIGSPKNRTAVICLPSPQQPGDEPFQSIGYVAGWGDTESDLQSKTLREATLTVLKDKECKDDLVRRRIFNNDGVFCAKSNPLANSAFQTVCRGDSGSPFITDEQGRFAVQGVVSLQLNEKQCSHQGDVQTPVIFTKVSWYIPWIRKTLKELEEELKQ